MNFKFCCAIVGRMKIGLGLAGRVGMGMSRLFQLDIQGWLMILD
jgi:hypothetical protein